MASRFYFSGTNATISPSYSSVWGAGPYNRFKLFIDTPASTINQSISYPKLGSSAIRVGFYQFISEPLDSISATLAVCKAAFLCQEDERDDNAYLVVIFRKCDEDGNNAADIGSIDDDTEFNDGSYQNRIIESTDLTNTAFSQGDRLIIEVGVYYNNTKSEVDYGRVYLTDNSGSDLPENDTGTDFYNSWIETGDTFTEASGDPPAAIKLGPMFAFA